MSRPSPSPTPTAVAQAPPPAPSPTHTTVAAAAPPPAPSEWCTASAEYNSEYNDYDVYVHSDEPNQDATATASNGETQSYYTDGTGYADIYLYADPGDNITVQVAGATCDTTA